jgi:predicted PurR-regulated permease PerM
MIALDEKKKFYAFLTAGLAAIIAVALLAPGAFKALVLAFGLAYLLDPLVDRLEARNVPRVASVLVIMVLATGLILLLLALAVPYLIDQAVMFVNEAPALAERALGKIAQLNVLPEEMTRSIPELLRDLKQRLVEGGFDNISSLATRLFQATTGIIGWILALVNLLIVPVFFFFFLKDIDVLREDFYLFLPDSVRQSVRDYMGMIDGVLAGFIRGQIIVAVILAVLYGAGLGLTGIRFGILIGVVSGLLFIVPYIGTILGIAACAMVLLVDFSSWGQVLGVAATFGISQTIEGYILTPRIVGNRVGLNQLETLVAILVGGEAGGLAGLLIAVPAAGIIKKSILMLKPEVPEEEMEIDPEGEPDEMIYMAGDVDAETRGSDFAEASTDEHGDGEENA